MADEPDNIMLRLLRLIRATQEEMQETQQVHGRKLDVIERSVDGLHQTTTQTLGLAANAHVPYEELEAQARELTRRVKLLEAR